MDPHPMCAALHAVKMLRLDVASLFNHLSAGLRDDHKEEEKEGKLMFEVQDMLASVYRRVRDLDQSVANLYPGSLLLHNSGFLTQESSLDKLSLYSPLVLSHKWTDKVHKYSSLAYSILNQNSFKKSQYSSAKRKRPLAAGYNIPPQQMESIISNIDRIFPDMSITVSRPFAANVVIQISLGRVLQAMIALKGIMIEWVVIKGYGESCNSTTDLMTESRHHVFRRITEHAHAATLTFAELARTRNLTRNSPLEIPEHATRNFLAWLNSYISLFTAPCKQCGKHLRDCYPPTWREYPVYEPYHYECKP